MVRCVYYNIRNDGNECPLHGLAFFVTILRYSSATARPLMVSELRQASRTIHFPDVITPSSVVRFFAVLSKKNDVVWITTLEWGLRHLLIFMN